MSPAWRDLGGDLDMAGDRCGVGEPAGNGEAGNGEAGTGEAGTGEAGTGEAGTGDAGDTGTTGGLGASATWSSPPGARALANLAMWASVRCLSCGANLVDRSYRCKARTGVARSNLMPSFSNFNFLCSLLITWATDCSMARCAP